MSNLWSGSIKTDGDYETLESIASISLTTDTTYTIQVVGKCYLCESSTTPTKGGFLVDHTMPVQYTKGTGTLYVRNLSTPCTINIAE